MKRYMTSISALLLTGVIAGAQALTGSYFLDNSLMRNRLNPAFTPRSSYFGLPAISNTGIDIYGNIGASDFLYPKDGHLYTFLNSNVSAEEFSKKITRYPGIDAEVNTDILNFGFYTSEKDFWSFDIGVKVNASAGVPKDFLMLLKEGMKSEQDTRSMKGFNAYADVAAYASLGYSRDLSDYVKGLKIGAKFRFYASMAHIGLDLGNTTLSMSGDKWTADANATGVIAANFIKYAPTTAGDHQGDNAKEGSTLSENFTYAPKFAPAGYGFSFDLGAEYRLSAGTPVDGLAFSFSALDLGGLFYNAGSIQSLKSHGNATFEGMQDIGTDGDASFDEVLEKIKEDFMTIADFELADPTNLSVSTCPKIYAGVEMPLVNDKMSFGLLYSAKFGQRKTTNELTLSYNLNPCKWFNMGLSWSFLNSWKTLGWIIEFSPKAGVDFFIGSDYTFFEVMPTYYIPVNKLWSNVRFGLNFMVGSKHRK